MDKFNPFSADCKLSTNEKAELLPCPFCGGRASSILDNDGTHYNIGCNDDDCAGYLAFTVYYKEIDTIGKEVIKVWNTRTEPQCQQVRPLAEFGDDVLTKHVDRYLRRCIVFNSDIKVLDIAKEIISIIRNHDKSSRNQGLDEVIEAIKEKAKKCRVYGNQFNEGDAIEAVEGIKQ